MEIGRIMSTETAADRQPGLRERKKARLRERILQTSVELFETRGYQQTRVADIVEALEISQPTFFRYFPSKDAVLREVMRQSMKSFRQAVARGWKAEHGDSTPSMHESLDRALVLLSDWARKNRARTLAFAELGLSRLGDPEDRPKPTQGGLFSNRAIRSWQEEGSLRADLSPDALGQVLGGSVIRVLYDWSVQPEPGYDLEARLREVVECFFHGAEKATR